MLRILIFNTETCLNKCLRRKTVERVSCFVHLVQTCDSTSLLYIIYLFHSFNCHALDCDFLAIDDSSTQKLARVHSCQKLAYENTLIALFLDQ